MKKFLILSAFFYSFAIFLSWWMEGNNLVAECFHLEPPMKMFTALMLILLSGAFYLIQKNKERFEAIISSLKTMVLSFSCIVAARQIVEFHGGDGGPFLSQPNSNFFNLPAIATIICLMLLSIQMTQELKQAVVNYWASITVMIISISILIGHLLKLPFLYFSFTPSMIGTAVDTACVLLSLSCINIDFTKIKDFFVIKFKKLVHP